MRGAFVRGVAGGTLEEVIHRLNILHALSATGVAVFNDGRAIERTVDKAMTSFLLKMHGVPTMDTWVTESSEEAFEIARACIDNYGSVVLKPLFGSQGKGVVRIRDLSEFSEHPPVNGVYYLQAYVRPQGRTYRDWRVFVINGHAPSRQCSARADTGSRIVRLGATCEPIQPDRSLRELAVAAANALTVDYAGVDLMRDVDGKWWVSEVNGIPAWQGLQRATSIDVTSKLVEAFIRKATPRDSALASA